MHVKFGLRRSKTNSARKENDNLLTRIWMAENERDTVNRPDLDVSLQFKVSLLFSAIHILVQTSFLMSCYLKIYPWLEEVRYNQTYSIDLMILILFKQVRQTWLFYQTSIVTFLSIFRRFLICFCCWANSQTFDQIDVFAIVHLHISCCIWVLKISAVSIGSTILNWHYSSIQ